MILDGKRNDIGSTAAAYATGYLGSPALKRLGGRRLDGQPLSGRRQLGAVYRRGRRARRRHVRAGQNFESRRRHVSGSARRRPAALPARRQAVDNWSRQTQSANAAMAPSERSSARPIPKSWPAAGGDAAHLAVGPRLWQPRGRRQRRRRERSTTQGLGAIINNSRAIIFAHSRKEYSERSAPPAGKKRSKRPRAT